ncbi:MAG: TlpA family protein disulfide reductase [Balneolales bacterium]|nr:TlpA family protein disulfide reductase [Balneolales bacterium]
MYISFSEISSPKTFISLILACFVSGLLYQKVYSLQDAQAPPHELRLLLEAKKGYDELEVMSGMLSALSDSNPWKKSYPQEIIIPEWLRQKGYEVDIIYITHDFVQHAWQSKLNGTLDSTFVMSALDSWGTDQSRLTDTELQLVTVVLLWENDDERSFLMYADSPPYSFDEAKVHEIPSIAFSDKESKPLVLPVRFELFRNDEIYTISSYLSLSKVNDFRRPDTGKPMILQSYYQYYFTEAEIGDKHWEIALHSKFMSPFYGEEGDVIQIRKKGGSWFESISLGQYVHFGDIVYQFVEARFDGSEIYLQLVPDFDSRRGSQAGMRVFGFEQETLDGQTFRIDDQLGKWVLLDFWGTWCAPCITELPYLQEAWRIFNGKEFEIVGIANDNRETLSRFLRENELGWPQLISHHSESVTINELFGIRSWPTTILLNPDGVIEPGKSLRGFLLEEMMAQLVGFNSTRAERLKKGDILVDIPVELIESVLAEEYEEQSISVHISGSDLSFAGRIPLYLYDGSFVRGLRLSDTTLDETVVQVYINGKPADLPLTGRFLDDENRVRYRFSSAK